MYTKRSSSSVPLYRRVFNADLCDFPPISISSPRTILAAWRPQMVGTSLFDFCVTTIFFFACLTHKAASCPARLR
jgi:hypothetical protein